MRSVRFSGGKRYQWLYPLMWQGAPGIAEEDFL